MVAAVSEYRRRKILATSGARVLLCRWPRRALYRGSRCCWSGLAICVVARLARSLVAKTAQCVVSLWCGENDSVHLHRKPGPMTAGRTPGRGTLIGSAVFFGILGAVFLVSGFVLAVTGPGRTRWGGAALLTLAVLVGWIAALAVGALRRGRAGPQSGRVLGVALGVLLALVGVFGVLAGIWLLWTLVAIGGLVALLSARRTRDET